MEFLASEIYNRSYSPSSNLGPAQTLASLLLDQLPISPRNTANLVGPPVQLRQHSRFLQNAAKHTRAIRAEALELPSEVRMAIVGLMETPGSRTRDSNHAIENLRALQWRLLMLKRGLQSIVKSGTVSYSTIEDMVDALRLAMRSIGYAQECIEDLDINGPRVEDARALLEEMEKSTMGSYLPELRKEMEARLEAGVAWKKVDEAMISHGLSPAVTLPTRFIYHRMRQYEDILPGVLATFTKGQEEGDMTHAKMYRRKPLVWSQKLLNAIRGRIKIFNIILERLAASHPQNDERFELLRDAKEALDISLEPTDECIEMVRGKGKRATWLEWANTVSSRLGLVEELVERAVMANRYLERYTWGESEVWEMDMEKKDLLFGVKLELVIIYDVAWRLERRMKQDMKDFREASLLLREEVPSEIEVSDTTPREPKQFGSKLPDWERELEEQDISSDRGRPKPSRSNAASIARALDSIWILD
ncbi:hypothetical protein RSOLAG22IIIB_00983 [Rhizoctonia solani]|uniref:Uncharacterized protein n=1 Tax=Rhizoctonia solani TaxID=456999 RepID=A0A0K6G229_9AGAM|nr:hypothetical protein RSOLAG22IIIB_00983 [Rhizoctonia solani]